LVFEAVIGRELGHRIFSPYNLPIQRKPNPWLETPKGNEN
jgi:hypothetical protein